jgi:hypothetical protein
MNFMLAEGLQSVEMATGWGLKVKLPWLMLGLPVWTNDSGQRPKAENWVFVAWM